MKIVFTFYRENIWNRILISLQLPALNGCSRKSFTTFHNNFNVENNRPTEKPSNFSNHLRSLCLEKSTIMTFSGGDLSFRRSCYSGWIPSVHPWSDFLCEVQPSPCASLLTLAPFLPPNVNVLARSVFLNDGALLYRVCSYDKRDETQGDASGGERPQTPQLMTNRRRGEERPSSISFDNFDSASSGRWNDFKQG